MVKFNYTTLKEDALAYAKGSEMTKESFDRDFFVEAYTENLVLNEEYTIKQAIKAVSKRIVNYVYKNL